MLVKLVEVHKQEGDRVHLDEIYVNSSVVTSIRQENSSIINEAIALGISEQASFSRITINEGGYSRTAIVVGSPSEIKTKLGIKNLLKG